MDDSDVNNTVQFYISKRFKKKVTKFEEVKRKKITLSIKKFYEEVKENGLDFNLFRKGFKVEQLKGCVFPFYKYYYDIHDRIVFVMASDSEGYSKDNEGIIFVDYWTHDDYRKKKRHIKIKEHENCDFRINDDEIDNALEEEYSEYYYDLNVEQTEILPMNQIEKIIDFVDEKLLVWLHEKQNRCLREEEIAILLQGGAGSGKTVIAINKLLQLYSRRKRCLYVTYSEELRQMVEKTVEKYYPKIEDQNYLYGIDIFTMDDFVVGKNLSWKKSIVHYPRFKEWHKYNRTRFDKKKKYETIDLWQEIRGIIKGRISNKNGDTKPEKNAMISEEDYFSLKSDKFSLEDKETIYRCACFYNSWLEEESLYDENDMVLGVPNEYYDYIVVDEVQDFTARQLIYILESVKNKSNIFFAGDFHQIVQPTYFDFSILTDYFYKSKKPIEYKKYDLNFNYRSSKEIVEFINELVLYRRRKIGAVKGESIIEADNNHTLMQPFVFLQGGKKNNRLLQIMAEKPKVMILVTTDEKKRNINEMLKIPMDRMMTVQEAKGLEYRYIVCYNFFSDHQEKWSEIHNGVGKRNMEYRYYTNLFYVAITRAFENVCIIEDEPGNEFLEECKDKWIQVKELDEDLLMINDEISNESWIPVGLELEQQGKHEHAAACFQRGNDNVGYTRCKAKQMTLKGDYWEAAYLMETIGSLEDSIKYYSVDGSKIDAARILLKLINEHTWDIDTIFIYMDKYEISPGLLLDSAMKDKEHLNVFNEQYFNEILKITGLNNVRIENYINEVLEYGI